MSRLGKQAIPVPAGTTVKIDGGKIAIKGPKGEVARAFRPEIKISFTPETGFTLTPVRQAIFERALWGTYAAHLKNMIAGVTTGFEKTLLLEGVGYKASVEGQNLVLNLGFSHPVKIAIPPTITVKAEKGQLTIAGNDRELVGQFAASLRAQKPPEPYKGKGFRYQDEVIRRKQGKKVVA